MGDQQRYRHREILGKPRIQNVEKGREESQKEALVQIRDFLEPLVQKSSKR